MAMDQSASSAITVSSSLPSSFSLSTLPFCPSSKCKQFSGRPISTTAVSAGTSALALAMSIMSTCTALASVSYNDVVAPAAVPVEAGATGADVSFSLDSVAAFVAENPLAVIAGAAVIGIPVVVSSLFSEPNSISAKEAFKKLGQSDIQLLDIRSSETIKVEGTPDLRDLKKRVFQIPYAGGNEAYLKKLRSKFKDPANTTLVVLDQFDGNSLSVAKYVTENGFEAAYAIKDGAEGPNGWRKNDLPWLLPRRGFQLDISSLKDVIDNTFSENPNLVSASLGIAAAAGVGLVVFSEAETALQLIGSVALVQLFVKRFFFAKDRQKTLKELQTFLDTKIAPKELVDEIKGMEGVMLPKYTEVPLDSTDGAAVSETTVAVEPAPEQLASAVMQVLVDNMETHPKERVLDTASPGLPKASRPLSPYIQFQGLKPPSSPTPSKP